VRSTNGLSHFTVDGKHLNVTKVEGLACRIGPQPIKSLSNLPGGLRTPMSIMADSDWSTTQAPAWRQQGEAVKGLVDASVQSDQGRLCHQGNLTTKIEFGGKGIEMDIRSKEKWTNSDGLTYQRVPSQLLNALT